jgi:hypothetical protein
MAEARDFKTKTVKGHQMAVPILGVSYYVLLKITHLSFSKECTTLDND